VTYNQYLIVYICCNYKYHYAVLKKMRLLIQDSATCEKITMVMTKLYLCERLDLD